MYLNYASVLVARQHINLIERFSFSINVCHILPLFVPFFLLIQLVLYCAPLFMAALQQLFFAHQSNFSFVTNLFMCNNILAPHNGTYVQNTYSFLTIFKNTVMCLQRVRLRSTCTVVHER